MAMKLTEKANGLLREFFPKHQSMRRISLVDVQHVLNQYHRKSLGYLYAADFCPCMDA